MISKLETSNWKEKFLADGIDKDAENLWASIKSTLLELRNEFVPLRTIKTGIDSNNKGDFPIGKTLQQAIKEKHSRHRCWIRGIK